MGSIHRILSVTFVALITLFFSLKTTTTNSAPNEFINQNLSGSMQRWGEVREYKISLDNNYVIFRADKDHDEIFELYSVPILGGTPIKLNEPFPINSYSEVESFQISSDSKYVVYSADHPNNNVTQIYSVPIHGGTSVNLNGDLVEWGMVHSFKISPDGKSVIFMADKETLYKRELYSTSIIGGSLTNLTPNIGIKEYKISPNSERVIYIANQDTNDVYELYSVSINGGSTTKLNGALVSDGDVSSFKISSDSNYVVYQADQQIDRVPELYSVPVTGGTHIKLNSDLAWARRTTPDYKISPDSRSVVFIADPTSERVDELFSVSITGGTPVKLDNEVGEPRIFNISANSQYVVYGTFVSLFSVPLLGGTPIKFDLGRAYPNPTISPGSSHVIFKFEPPNSSPDELHSTLITGGTPIKISSDLDEVLSIVFYRFSPDNNYVYYVANRKSKFIVATNLYRVPLTGGPSLKLNAEDKFSDINGLEISSNSKFVVYRYLNNDRGYALFVAYDNSIFTYKSYLPTIIH